MTLDGVSLVAALTALRAELSGEASGIYRATLFAFTGASAAANWWHGRRTGGVEAALYLGGMSVAVAVVFALALRQIRHEDRRRAGRVTERLPRFSVAHWARYPRLTWRAWSLAVRDGHASPRDALDAALGRKPGASAPGRDVPAVTRRDAPALPPGDAPVARQPGAPGRASRRSQADMEASALEVLARQPGIAGAELGRAIGASPRTGQRLLVRLTGRVNGASHPAST